MYAPAPRHARDPRSRARIRFARRGLPTPIRFAGRAFKRRDCERFVDPKTQLDATALPGKAFDLTFEFLEKNCHATCPKSMIVTTKLYNPNMKVDILAIPPRVHEGDLCCKWQFSLRTEDDPEFVPVDLITRSPR
jgi:hypothetical protein